MAGLVSGPYIQHNPLFPNGIDALVGYLKQAGSLLNEARSVAFDGDLALVHVRYPNWPGKEYAAVDIFQFDAAGKIVEHWDALNSANENGIF